MSPVFRWAPSPLRHWRANFRPSRRDRRPADFAWCHPSRPVPVIAFHGTADPIVACTGDAGANARLLPSRGGSGSADQQSPDHHVVNGPGPQSIPDNAATWARRRGCESEPVQRQIATDVIVSSYPCPADATVDLYSIIGGGHIWPGTTSISYPAALVGGNTSSIDANQII